MRHFAVGVAVALGITGSLLCGHIAHADSPYLKVVSPNTTNITRGNLSIGFQLQNADPHQYIYFWAVDYGKWNQIEPDNSDLTQSRTTISTSNWRWRQNNTYTLQLIALNYYNNSRLEQDVKISLSDQSPSLQLPSAAPVDIVAQADKLFADPKGDVSQRATAWGQSHPQQATAMNYLAQQPMTPWFGGWNTDVRKDVSDYIDRAVLAQAVPAFVVYNIPNRDCGSYSAGGSATGNDYLTWVRKIADGVGERRAMIILEPDAVAGSDCLDDTGKADRYNLLRQAIAILKTNKTQVYLDAGHPNWKSAQVMAAGLKQAGISNADGFSLNVSNFVATKDNVTYGTQISKLVNNKHFIIDTSRNGNGSAPSGDWCNPSGRALGRAPSLQTGNDLVDAYLWVKGPGGSDGTCGQSRSGTAAPSAGSWWPEYAQELLDNTNL